MNKEIINPSHTRVKFNQHKIARNVDKIRQETAGSLGGQRDAAMNPQNYAQILGITSGDGVTLCY